MKSYSNFVLQLVLVLFMSSYTLADIIVESGAGGINNSSYSEKGIKWQNSTSKSTAAGLTPSINARWCDFQAATTSFDTAIFNPLINTAGNYQLFVTWNLGNASSVRYQVFNTSGIQTSIYLLQDGYGQQGPSNAHQWISIGTYDFDSGTSGHVELSSADTYGRPGTTGNFRVYSDAVKWVSTAPPVAPVNLLRQKFLK